MRTQRVHCVCAQAPLLLRAQQLLQSNVTGDDKALTLEYDVCTRLCMIGSLTDYGRYESLRQQKLDRGLDAGEELANVLIDSLGIAMLEWQV